MQCNTVLCMVPLREKEIKLALVIKSLRVQFGISLHKWVFQQAEIAQAASASAISAF